MKKVKEFTEILKMRSNLRTPTLIKKKILEIINDLVYTNRSNIFRSLGKFASFRRSKAFIKIYLPN